MIPPPHRYARLWLAMCLLFVSACAGARPRQVVVAWHTLSGARERALLRLIDRWNQANVGDAVVIAERRDPDMQHRAMLEGATSGRLPDLALVEPSAAAVYDQRELLVPFDHYVVGDDPASSWDDADRSDLYPFIQHGGRSARGHWIAMPFGGDVRLVLANRDWLTTIEQPEFPSTWEAFDQACARATDRFSGTMCFGFDPNDGTIFDWLDANGAPVYDPLTQQVQIASVGTIAALERLVNYLQTGQAYRATSLERSRDAFAAARALFIFTTSDQLSDFVQIVRERSNFALLAGLLPSAGQTAAASLRAPVWVIVKRTDERQRAAWQFINWLLESEQTAQWAADTGELPARASAINLLSLNPDQPLDSMRITLLRTIAPRARLAPVASGWPCVEDELAQAMRQIIDGQPLTDTLVLAQSRAQDVINAECTTR